MKLPNTKEIYDLKDLDKEKLKTLNITLSKDENAEWYLMKIKKLINISKTHVLVFDENLKWCLSSYLDRYSPTKNALELF